jgi:hypothetical protein
MTTFEKGVWRRYVIVLDVAPVQEETTARAEEKNVILREWERIKTVLVRALRYFPEARDAVVKGLWEISADEPEFNLVT